MDQALKDKRLWAVFALVAVVFVALFLWSQQSGAGDEATEPEPASLVEESPSTLPTDMTGIPTAVAPPSTDESGAPLSSAPTTDAPTESEPDEEATDPESGLPWVGLDELPPEAVATVALIDAGGPYPYDQDGGTFGNFEGLLPEEYDGYYEEFTVETPGSDDRGARRIVAGDEGELYWTDDHYASFSRIDR